MSRFFINHPVFAWVISLLIMLAGSVALYTLPVAQFPDIAPPEISITARYPGASAKTIEDSVTQIIEQQLKGIDKLNYVYSTSDASGQAVVTLSFAAGADVNTAQMQVQNKLQLALPLLPQAVQRQGLNVARATRNYLLIASFVSEDDSMSSEDISDYIASTIQDPVSRVEGAGDVSVFGSQYAMRIWIDPARFEQYRLSPSEVVAAVQAQNTQVSGGQIGGLPALPGQQINLTVEALSRMDSIEQFRNILLRANPDGSTLMLKDVARVELDSENFNMSVRYNGKPASSLGIRLATGANALQTADAIKAEIDNLSRFFPPGLTAAYSYDSTPFVRISIQEVFKTLGEAIVLVFLVMFLFLQNLRATLIPTIAVPVVLLGTFGALAIAGYSINTLTMFGMVLAIGLLVDDAIVVVENVERIMREENISPKEATRRSMRQISGALIGITLILAAVFVPMSFFGGAAGVIYRQFSITLITAMTLSVLTAMILTPALCATLLKPRENESRRGFFACFNRGVDQGAACYQRQAAHMARKPWPYFLIYGGCIGLAAFFYYRLPTGFLPDEDQGRLFVRVQLPPGASEERTAAVVKEVEQYFLDKEKAAVADIMSITGWGLGVSGQNTGTLFVRLKDWSERQEDKLRVAAVRGRAMATFSRISAGNVFAFAPPAISELGNASGFDFELIDRSGQGHEALMAARDQLLAKARQHPDLRNVRANGLDDVEQYKIDIDFVKAGTLGLRQDDINTTISAYWGGLYVNDFMDKGRTKRVYLQADAPYRMQPGDFGRYHVRNALGEMAPFSAFASLRSIFGSPRLERYNGLPSVEILGEAVPGKSSGDAMAAMESLARELPDGFDFTWTGLSYQERQSGSQTGLLYTLSVVVIFLCLAALYESWSIPLAVILAIPLGVLGVLAGASLRGLANDIYLQVALLTIVGLTARNAVLIVEFAKARIDAGQELLDATLDAIRLRLRPILMTAFVFIIGTLPLAISKGAGSGGQNAIGAAVMVGMIVTTALGLYYTPLLFTVVSRLFHYRAAVKE
jgi:multidrug efflux pump